MAAKDGKRRRPRGRGSVFQRKDGRWVAQLPRSNGVRPSPLYARSEADARHKLTIALRDQKLGLPQFESRQTVRQFLEYWLENVAKSRLAPTTHHSYESCIRLHLVPTIGAIRLAELRPQQVQSMLNDMAKKFSPATIHHTRGILSAALHQAQRWEIIPRNVASLSTVPRLRGNTKVPLTPAQTRRLIDAAWDHPLGPMVTLAATTGLSYSELAALRRHDIDLGGQIGSLRVREGVVRVDGRWVFRGEGKRPARVRTIPLTQLAIGHLTRYLARVEREPHDLLFQSKTGTPVHYSLFARTIRRYGDQAGLSSSVTPHLLRHGAASLLAYLRVPDRTIADYLGHSRVDTSKWIYEHTFPAGMTEAVGDLDQLLGPGPDNNTSREHDGYVPNAPMSLTKRGSAIGRLLNLVLPQRGKTGEPFNEAPPLAR